MPKKYYILFSLFILFCLSCYGESGVIEGLKAAPNPTPLPPAAYPVVYSVSSEPQADHPGSNILDDNLDGESRWSAQEYPQWIIIDYGQTQPFSTFSLYTVHL